MKQKAYPNLLLFMVLLTSSAGLAGSAMRVYNICDFGAIGDGQTLNTRFIQKAINSCAEAGGGTVYLPPGTYMAGTVFLKSNVTLHLEAGAVLLQSKSMDDYVKPEEKSYAYHTSSNYVFLHAKKVRNVSIIGPGTIDGNMALEQGSRGPLPVLFENCRNILIRDIGIVNSPGWALTFFGCRGVDVIRVKCLNSFADGINPVCSQNVLYDGLLIEGSGDDPIAIKNDSTGYTYKTRPDCGYLSENIIITNTTIRNTGHSAIKFGTGTYGVFRNIIISNCTFENVGAMFKISLMRPKYEKTPDRKIENIMFSNITAKKIKALLDWTTIDVSGPIIRNISIENVIADGVGAPSVIYGLADAPISDVTLSDIKVTYRGKAVSYWLKTRHVHGLKFSNLEIDPAGAVKTLLLCENSSNLELSGLRIKGSMGTGPVIELNQVRDVFIHSSRLPSVETFLYAHGDSMEQITLDCSDIKQAKTPFDAGEEVRAGIVSPAAERVKYSDLRVSKGIKANEAFAVEVTATNTKATGAFKAEVLVDGNVAGGEWFWLKEGENRRIRLTTCKFYEPREYDISIGSLATTAIVKPTPAAFEFGEMMKITSPAAVGSVTTVTAPVKNIGGSEGTKQVNLYADEKLIASKKIKLLPGEEGQVTLKHSFEQPGPCKLRIGDFPVWPFATFSNTQANFYQTREKIVIEAGGGRASTYCCGEHSAIYIPDVEGDFVVTAKLLSQEPTGPYAAAGLVVRNDIADANGRSPGLAVLYIQPKYGGLQGWRADFDGDGTADSVRYGLGGYPMWFRIEKVGKTFTGYTSVDYEMWYIPKTGRWDVENADEGVYEIPSANDVQDVGFFAYAFSSKGELCRVELKDFKIEKPVDKSAVTYTDLKVSKTELEPDESFTVSAVVTNTSSVKGPVKAGFYIDNHEPSTKWLDLEPGQSQKVEFTTTPKEIQASLWLVVDQDYLPGIHQVTIGTAKPVTIKVIGKPKNGS